MTDVLPGKPKDLKVTKSLAEEVRVSFKPALLIDMPCEEAFEAK